MDQEAKARIMSREYKSNDGMATDWSKRAQRAADRNEYRARQSGSQQESEPESEPESDPESEPESESGWECVIL